MNKLTKTLTGIFTLTISSVMLTSSVLADSSKVCTVNSYGVSNCNVIGGPTAFASSDMLLISAIALAFGVMFIIMSKVISVHLKTQSKLN